jgi:hypothetical protein
LLQPRAEPPPQTENKTIAAAQRKFFYRSWRRIRNPKGRKAKKRKGKEREGGGRKKKLWVDTGTCDIKRKRRRSTTRIGKFSDTVRAKNAYKKAKLWESGERARELLAVLATQATNKHGETGKTRKYTGTGLIVNQRLTFAGQG